ncbi:2OG-Fe(II) oxygenase [Nocardia huaxiensis]|uniref:2OG-Fe(II) oxygenase n=1 Tax=Nocardia huaxiensis TaxID=2755382 RepID=UPI001E2BABAC|nr:2OG-Fe(II) oxygenase [Nocardia huaxiensis]UFT00297.1 2OG-Fe(II) oxygenase [Nocardia huaxiensis]
MFADPPAAPIIKVENGIGDASGRICFLLRGVLDAAECARVIDTATAAGFGPTGAHYPPSYRDNDRLVRDDPALADALYARICTLLPQRIEADGVVWRLHGLNERFRYCRYRDGQRFGIHRDGAHARSATVVSRLTCMIYLNDETEFTGGTTRFHANGDPRSPVLGDIRPERGTIVVFDHALWHTGEPVTAGTKWVMRTDVLYERETAALDDLETGETGSTATEHILRGHDGYVWSVVALPGGALASASRDRTVRIWDRTPNGYAPHHVLRGHDSSVTALLALDDGIVVSGCRAGAIRAWQHGTPRTVGCHDGAVLSLKALPDNRILSGGADGHVRWWSLRGSPAAPGHEWAVGSWVWGLASIGDRVFAACEDGSLRWRNASGMEDAAWTPYALRALAVDTGGAVITGDAGGWLRRWEATASGWRDRVAWRAHIGAVCAVVVLPDGRVASGGEDGAVRVWRGVGRLAVHRHDDFVRGLAALPDGRVASASYDGTVRVWESSARPIRRGAFSLRKSSVFGTLPLPSP